MSREIRVGVLVLAAIVTIGMAVFFIGQSRHLFTRSNRYFVHFVNVSGLSRGSPVQLNGVNVGQVQSIVLPEDIHQERLTVWVKVERRYANRIRTDSLARIKTLGLLGDKYVQVSSGSSSASVIPAGGEIPAASETSVDKLLASGEDVVDNVVEISHSLRNILSRLDRGEGLLGQLTVNSKIGDRVRASTVTTLDNLAAITTKINKGQGSLGELLNNQELADHLTSASEHLDRVVTKLDQGDGAFGTLLNDPQAKSQLASTLKNLEQASVSLAAVVRNLDNGKGLLPRLLNDKAYGDELSRELQETLANLSSVAEKLNQGNGTLGALINDPDVYEAINDIIIGVNQSRLLRWLIRNREKAGINKRYKERQEQLHSSSPPNN